MSGNIAALRLRNRMYAGALNSAALQAELAEAYQLGAWRQLCAGGAGMAQMLSVPDLRAVVQAAPAAADEVLRSGNAVGQILEPMLTQSSAAMRVCTSFDRAINNNAMLVQLLESANALDFINSSPWGKARLLAAFTRAADVTSVLSAAINNQAALSMIQADGNAGLALRSSTGLPKVDVPAQSVNGTPSGAGAYASSENPSYPAFRAFDKNISTSWIPGGSSQWLRYAFAAPVFIHTVDLTSSVNSAPKDVRVQRSADGGVTWEDVLQTTYSNSGGLQTRYLSKAGKATHWRLYIDTIYASSIQIFELNFIGF